MLILGIRTSANCIRYAILKIDKGIISLENSASENRLLFPKSAECISRKLTWLYSELERILHENKDISHVAIKTNEFVSESLSRRHSSYMDAAVALFAIHNKLNVDLFLYSQIKKRLGSKSIKTFMETTVSKTSKYWNSQMADAIAAAWKAAQNNS